MPIANDKGLWPVGHLQGLRSFQQRLLPTRGKNPTQLRIGDVVTYAVSGAVRRIADAASGGDTPLAWGVVGAVYNADRRPFTFSQPAAGPHIAASTDGFVGVYEDPHIIYGGNMSATASFLDFGKFVSVRVCAPNTAAGRSGMGISRVDIANTAAGHPIKLYGILGTDGTLDEVAVCGAANNDVAVVLVNSQFSNPWFRNVTGAADVSGMTE